MTTLLDELAMREEKGGFPSDAEIGGVIASIIEMTRRHWAAVPDEYLADDG